MRKTKSRRRVVPRTLLVQELEEKRLLTLPGLDTFTPPMGPVHQIGITALADDTNADTVINAAELLSAGSTYNFSGIIQIPSGNISDGFHGGVTLQLIRSGTDVIGSTGSFPSLPAMPQRADFSINVPVSELNPGTNNLNLRLVRPTFTSINAYNFTITVDATPPTKPEIDLKSTSDTGISNTDNLTKNTSLDFTATFPTPVQATDTIELLRDGVALSPPQTKTNQTGTSVVFTDPNAPQANYVYRIRIRDQAGNETLSDPLNVVVDTTAPAPTDAPLLARGSDTGSNTTDRETYDSTPSFTIGNVNPEGVAAGVPLRLIRRTGGTEATAASNNNVKDTTFELTDPGANDGVHFYSVETTDAAGNPARSAETMVTINTAVGADTPGGPGTPVFSTGFAASTGSGTAVKKLQPWTMSFDKTTQTIWLTFEKDNQLGQFDPATGQLRLFPVDVNPNAANPHGIFFDFDTHLLPRVWFPHHNGDENVSNDNDEVPRLNYLDLNSGGSDQTSFKLYTYDLQPWFSGTVGTGGLPSGATTMQVSDLLFGLIVPGSELTFEPGTSNEEQVHVTAVEGSGPYILHLDRGSPKAHNQGTSFALAMALHAVFVDPRGNVWVSAEHGNTILELNFDRLQPNGTATLNETEARITVHRRPEIGDTGLTTPHGLEVILDDTTGEAYVWITELQTGRVVLLRSGAGSQGNDLWAEWSVDESLANLTPDDRTTLAADTTAGSDKIQVPVTFLSGALVTISAGQPNAEQRRVILAENDGSVVKVKLDRPLGQTHQAGDQVDYAAGHALFVAVDDNETPGLPQDDQVVFSDPGQGNRLFGDLAGLVRRLDPSAFLTDPSDTRPSPLRTWQIPTVPAIFSSDKFAGTNQPFVDREGTVFFIDRLSGVGRFSPDESSDVSSSILAPITTYQSDVPDSFLVSPTELSVSTSGNAIKSTSSPLANTTHKNVERDNHIDYSPVGGLDQYLVAGNQANARRNNQLGPLRGALTAGNVLVGSLTQTSELTTTVFAETARRQVAAVESPNGAVVEGALRGRMVFQTLRDGSLVMTSRPDGSILDQQINLSSLLARFGSPSFESLLIDGDPSAVVSKNGNSEVVYVFGKSKTDRTLVVYKFDVSGALWTAENLHDPSKWQVDHSGAVMDPAVSGFPVSDPSAFVDVAGQVYAFVTTNTGHLLAYSAAQGGIPRDLTKDSGTTEPVYASVGVVEQPDNIGERIIYVYGTDQQGHLLEFAFQAGVGISGLSPKGVSKVVATPSREQKVFQNVTAIVHQGVRHVFATDGNSRLVHFRISGDGTVLPTVNVSQNVTATLADNTSDPATQANDRAFGYFDFQKDYAARVYSGLAAVEGSDGALYVYGTNGKDFVEFKFAGGDWTAANLTNDVLASSHQPSTGLRQPANEVFGAPAAYVTRSTDVRNGDRHILQINADGEIVEYYRLQQATQFQTQNVSLRLGNTPTLLQGASSEIVLAGADAGDRPLVRGFDRTLGGQVFEFPAYNDAFRGGVRVAAGDVNGDGIPDIITAAGPGGGPHVRVFDGVTRLQLPGLIGSFMAYNPAFTGGVFVASGDIDGDGRDDVITGADAGGGPHVRVFSGATGGEIFGFFAYDARFTGGVRVASGDVNGDGRDDVVTGAGPGGGPHVRVFNGLTQSPLLTPAGSFFAYSPAFGGGVFVATGSLNADGKADIITGAGAGGGPHVRAFSGADGSELSSFFAYSAEFGGGVRVAAADVDGDGLGEILTAPGPGQRDVQSFDPPGVPPLSSFAPFNASLIGAFIASAPRSVAGAPLRLAAGAAPSGAAAALLNENQLAETVDSAFAALGSHGLSIDRLTALREIPIRIEDLSPGLLGLFRNGEVLIDSDASGLGWFVDPTPNDDEEFLVLDHAGASIASSGLAAGRIDLRTVVLHELAHALGADHAAGGNDSLMAETVAPGVRRRLSAALVDSLLAQ